MSVSINGTSGITFNNASTTTVGALGDGQTWQSVSRTSGTTYTNSTGKPIVVQLSVSINTTSSITVVVNGLQIFTKTMTTAVTAHTENFIVPNGNTYVITATQIAAFTINELR